MDYCLLLLSKQYFLYDVAELIAPDLCRILFGKDMKLSDLHKVLEPSEIVKKGINTMSEGYGAAVLERAENKGFDKGYDKGTTNERTRMTKLFKYLRTNGLEAEMDKALDNPEYMKKLFKLYNM